MATVEQIAEILESNRKTMETMNLILQSLAAERSQVPATSATSAPSKEQILDTLGRSVTEFHYDPENGVTFDSWFNRHADSFTTESTGLEKEDLVRLLIRKLSTSVYTSYDDYIAPKKFTEITLDDHISKLKTLFGRKKSIFSLRFECLNHTKRGEEDFTSYMLEP